MNIKPRVVSNLTIALSMLTLMGCAPALGPAPDARPAAPAPRLPGMTESRFVTLEGERVYLEVGGKGTSVVMVHGIGAGNSSHLWRENTGVLTRSHRVYAFDWPGFARSGARPIAYTNDLYVAVLRAFIRDVVREPVAIIGGSLGSDYAIRVAAENPELVTRMLLSNPTGYTGTTFNERAGRRPDTFRLFTETLVGGLTFGAVQSEGGLNFFLYNTVYLDWRRVTPEVTNTYLENLQGPAKQYAPFSFFSGFLDQSVRTLWPQTRQPALLVWGSDDVFTPIGFAQEFLKARPDVKLEVLRGRAIPYDEDADRFNTLALAFLK